MQIMVVFDEHSKAPAMVQASRRSRLFSCSNKNASLAKHEQHISYIYIRFYVNYVYDT